MRANKEPKGVYNPRNIPRPPPPPPRACRTLVGINLGVRVFEMLTFDIFRFDNWFDFYVLNNGVGRVDRDLLICSLRCGLL